MSAIPIEKLIDWDPFQNVCWPELKYPITKSEIEAAIKAKDFCTNPVGHYTKRAQHIARVAYLVEQGWDDSINIDVGVPELDYLIDWIIIDGNHRLAAAIFRGDFHIEAAISGDLKYAEKLFGMPENLLIEHFEA